jgi:hypothetical protein
VELRGPVSGKETVSGAQVSSFAGIHLNETRRASRIGGTNMKIKVALVTACFVAGLAASLALASPSKGPKGPHEKQTTTTTATTTTTTSAPATPKCDQVELKGTALSGTVTFTVKKASKKGRSLVGTQVTLVVPADAKVKAKACSTGGAAPLTLRLLHVNVPHAKP